MTGACFIGASRVIGIQHDDVTPFVSSAVTLPPPRAPRPFIACDALTGVKIRHETGREEDDMPIYVFEDRKPRISPTAYVDPSAVIIGRVYVGDGCYVGPGAVMRGDFGAVVMLEGSSLQDNAVIHARPEEITFLGPSCTIGHSAVLHGCQIEGNVLVGMNAVVSDGAVLEEGCVVASGAVVTEGTRVEAHTMVAGVPATVKGRLDEAGDALLRIGSSFYQSLVARYRESCEEIPREEAARLYGERRDPD
jgi:phenylacetic acid degradation protein